MAEMKKTWTPPRNIWVNFQANEYVTACRYNDSPFAHLGATSWKVDCDDACVAAGMGTTNLYFFDNAGTDMTFNQITTAIRNGDFVRHDHSETTTNIANQINRSGWVFLQSDVNAIINSTLATSNEIAWDQTSSKQLPGDLITYFGNWTQAALGIISNGFGRYGYLSQDPGNSGDASGTGQSTIAPITPFIGGNVS